MGTKKEEEARQKQEETIRKTYMPKRNQGELFAIVLQLMGGDRIKALCEDGKERSCRIPGKLRKRVWLRQGDLIVVRLWDFDPTQADVVWRYLGFQLEYLKRKGVVKNLPI